MEAQTPFRQRRNRVLQLQPDVPDAAFARRKPHIKLKHPHGLSHQHWWGQNQAGMLLHLLRNVPVHAAYLRVVACRLPGQKDCVLLFISLNACIAISLGSSGVSSTQVCTWQAVSTWQAQMVLTQACCSKLYNGVGTFLHAGQICLIDWRGSVCLVICSSHRLVIVEGALFAQFGLGRLGLDLAIFLCAVAKW